jgi:hypothetical protein
MKKIISLLLVLVLLAGVAVFAGLADPLIAGRIEASLIDAGVDEKRAECMAGRMVERLNVVQLWKLQQGMAAQDGEPESGYGLGELIKRLRRVEDGEAVAVLTTSAGLCALGIG